MVLCCLIRLLMCRIGFGLSNLVFDVAKSVLLCPKWPCSGRNYSARRRNMRQFRQRGAQGHGLFPERWAELPKIGLRRGSARRTRKCASLYKEFRLVRPDPKLRQFTHGDTEGSELSLVRPDPTMRQFTQEATQGNEFSRGGGGKPPENWPRQGPWPAGPETCASLHKGPHKKTSFPGRGAELPKKGLERGAAHPPLLRVEPRILSRMRFGPEAGESATQRPDAPPTLTFDLHLRSELSPESIPT